jgi:hypothetical protein
MSVAGVLGGIGGKQGGHEAGAGVRMVMEKNDGPTGDAGPFTMRSQARTLERGWGRGWVMGGVLRGCLGLIQGV